MLAGYISAQTAPQPLQVSRQYGITSNTEVFDNRSVQRQCSVFGFMVTGHGSGSWSVQLEYADTAITGPWTAFSTGVVSNTSTVLVGGGYGYHQWMRLNTTIGSTIATLSCAKDFYVPTAGSGGSGGGTVSLLTGSANINPGTVQDGDMTTLGSTIPVSGAAVGDTVQVYTSTPLPSGMGLFGDVTSANTVTVRFLSLFGAPYSPGSILFGAAVLHYNPSGGGSAVQLTGTATFNPGTIQDGTLPTLSTTATVTGAAIGDLVYISTNGTMPAGIRVFGNVTSANTVTLRLLDMSGSVYSPGSITFNVTVWH